MVKSRSGALRTAIGGAKARLLTAVNEAKKMQKGILSEDPTTLTTQLITIEDFASTLKIKIDSVMEKDAAWMEIIASIEDEIETTAEEALYESAAVTEGYLQLVDYAKELCSLLTNKITRANRPPVAPAVPAALAAGTGYKRTAKLPELKVEKFDGDPIKFKQFMAIHKNNIGDHPHLSTIEKYSYLQGQLTGIALSAIDGLEVTEGTYEIAVSMLKKRFQRDDSQIIKSLHGQLKLVKQASTDRDLRKAHDQCEAILRQLKSVGQDIDTDTMLVGDILSKYPLYVVKDLFRRFNVKSSSTTIQVQDALRNLLDENDQLTEMYGNLKPYANTETKSSREPNQYSEAKASTSTSSTSFRKPEHVSSAMSVVDKPKPAPSSSKPMAPCHLCGGAHFNAQCEKYTTAEARVKRLEAVGRCGKCYGKTHATADCKTSDKWLRCFYCKATTPHKSALCPIHFGGGDKRELKSSATSFAGVPDKPKRNAAATTSCGLSFSDQSLLPLASTTIINPETGKKKRIRLLLDSGSHRSYVTENLASCLGSDLSKTEKLQISVFGSKRTLTVESSRVKFELALKQPGGTISVCLNTSPIITECDLSPGKFSPEAKRQVEAMRYAMADDMDSEDPPEILIGTDYMWCFMIGAAMPVADGLFLIPTSFGLVLSGSYESEDERVQPTLLCITERTTPVSVLTTMDKFSTQSKAKPIQPDIDEFWSLEKIGICDDPIVNEDEKAQQQFDETVSLRDGRYFVCWPFNDNKHKLRSNYQMALRRFVSMANRLATSEKSILEEYFRVIDNQLKLSVIERVPPDEVLNPKFMCHYIAHHPVVRVGHQTTKLRVVYDASAKCGHDSVSLNECMYRGPVLLPNLCAILLRFRLSRVALVSDIEKAFLQLALQESERDVTRFLWFEDPETMDVNKLAVYRFARVPFGVISSPFLLGATIIHHLNRIGTPTATKIVENVYVDNVITGSTDEAAALRFYNESKAMFKEASMNLREWCSNSDEVMEQIPENDRCASRSVKVLGLKWDSEEDQLSLQGNWGDRVKCKTKRDILKAIASIYDPLGLFQPCTLQAKCFLRKLWVDQLAWDADIGEVYRLEWAKLHATILPIFDVKMPRWINSGFDPANTTLVAFSDASEDAYAAAIYLRVCVDNNPARYCSTLIYSKSRLAPKLNTKTKADDITIPRLELLGLTIAASATEFVRESLKSSVPIKAFLMCDSTIALGWLRAVKTMPVFIRNRVKKIQQLTDAEFHHVPGPENPADVCTRGLTGEELKSSTFWWSGPEWLKIDSFEWPTRSKLEPISSEELNNREASRDPPVFHCLAAGEAKEEADVANPCGIDPMCHSSYRKLVRRTAIWLKFVKWRVWDRLSDDTKNAKPKIAKIFEDVTIGSVVLAVELSKAKKMWIKAAQATSYEALLKAIRDGKQHPLIRQLDVYLDDDGIIRCAGRLKFADLSFDTIRPKLMPKNHRVTELMIKDAHEKLLHSGISHTLSEIRRDVWIPQGRNAVRKVITRCILCRKMKGPPFALPRMPHWPRERISKCLPFQFAGVDYLGPISVVAPCTHDDISTADRTQKMWVALFTCLSTRAVHLECVMDCTPTSFIDCLSRFVSRRGSPELMISDNAPQFRLSKDLFDRTWSKVLTDNSVRSYISTKGIVWKFTTALAPWMGGCYERMVGLVKSTFKSAVGRKLLKFEEFNTLMVEVEAIVNSRPLTYVNSDIDSGLALRPMDFLTSLPTGTSEVDPAIRPIGGDAGKNLLRYWKQKQRRLDSLWRQFYDDYLVSLRERGQIGHRNKRSDIYSTPKEGEVVLVKNPDAPRGTWKLGKVIRIIPSKDNNIRSVELLLPNKMTIQRSISHIYPLEVPTQTTDVNPVATAAVDDSEDEFDGFTEEDLNNIPPQLQLLDNLTALNAKAVNRSTKANVMAALAMVAVTTYY